MKSLFLCATLAVLLVLGIAAGCRGGRVRASGTDEAVTGAVQDRIASDPAMAGAGVDVETRGGTVTLSGSVKSREQEQRAAELARAVPGVNGVRSRLVVRSGGRDGASSSRSPSGSGQQGLARLKEESRELADRALRKARKFSHAANSELNDASITAQVKTMLAIDKYVKSLPIEVETQNGVVTLTGTIDSKTKEARAVQLAYSVEGVRTVRSDLKIRQSE